ncbi:MAG TPA: response regulator [Mycobacteriales bacterium]|nr:response regulator [Mycobacteriales bacterium]
MLRNGSRPGGRPARILLVEDSVADHKLVEMALAESGGDTELLHADDGAAALVVLDEVVAGRYPRPDVVLLDLNMPRASGVDVLRRVKGDPALRTIPVVVFSTSRSDVDVAVAYAAGANAYVVKPLDLQRFMTVVRSIEEHWTGVVRLP